MVAQKRYVGTITCSGFPTPNSSIQETRTRISCKEVR